MSLPASDAGALLAAENEQRAFGRRLREVWQLVWHDLAGLVGMFAAIAWYLRPSFSYGTTFGTFDAVIGFTSLGSGAYQGPVHNYTDADVASQMETWNLFDWRQIHAGHFPFWNPDSLLGLPQFANFQSSVLSLPDLLSYAAPARYAWFVVVIAKLVIAGTGTYVFARVIGLRPLASSFAGIAFCLSGGFASDLSWPLTDVMCWIGWIAGLAVLTYRYPHRWRYVAGLAVVVAFFVYGGFPTANVSAALLLGFAGSLVLITVRASRRRVSWSGLGRALIGIGAGLGLSMPLIVPGSQYISGSHAQTEVDFGPVTGRALTMLVAPGYYGSPIHGSRFLLAPTNFYETVSYVGIVVLVLGLVAVVTLPKHPVVVGLAGGSVLLVCVAYGIGHFHPLDGLLRDVGLAQVAWRRVRLMIGFPTGVLAGIGLEAVQRSRGRGRAARAFGFVAASSLLLIGGLYLYASTEHRASIRSVHYSSLVSPLILALITSAGAGLVLTAGGRGNPRLRAAVCGLVVTGLWLSSGFWLASVGAPLNTWTQSFYPTTPAMQTLSKTVGTGLVGIDDGRRRVQSLSALGYYPELNMAYGVAEFAGHDPLIPQDWFTVVAPGQGNGGLGLVIPSIASVAEAREYGVSWLLLPAGRMAPAGSRYDSTVAGERLYFVPDASRFTFVAGGSTGDGQPVAWTSPSDGRYVIQTSSQSGGELIVRVTNLPGWHATIDGRPASLSSYDSVMQELSLPAGKHTVDLSYEPDGWNTGLVLAAVTALVMIIVGLVSLRRRRRLGMTHFPPDEFDDGLRIDWAKLFARKSQPRHRERPSWRRVAQPS